MIPYADLKNGKSPIIKEMHKILFANFMMALFFSCQYKNNDHTQQTTDPESEKFVSQTNQFSKANYLRIFVKKIGFVKLPYSYSLDLNDDDFKYLSDAGSNDTIFFPEERSIIGVLPDTSTYFGILYYEIGDDLYPKLIIFDKGGNKIDEALITNSTCPGWDCYFETCTDLATIDQKLNIHLYCRIETIDCDENGERMTGPDAYNCSVLEVFGKITKNGKIILGKELDKPCK